MVNLNEEIVFHTPGRLAAALPYALQVAGDGIAIPGGEPVRKRYDDHVLILAMDGEGAVEYAGRHFRVLPGMVLWLDTSRPYSHGAAGLAPWRYLWMGLRGSGLDALHGLLDLRVDPLFAPAQTEVLTGAFRQVLDVARGTRSGGDTAANAAIAVVLDVLAQARSGSGGTEAALSDPRIAAVAEAMRNDPAARWDVETLATLAGLSASQLFRRFRAVTGATPMDHLRQLRITTGKHLLSETSLSVGEIAGRCGYADPYHFSRDFRRLTGTTPSRFRSWFR